MACYGAYRPTWGFHSRSMPCRARIAPAFSVGRHCTCVRDTAQQWIIHYFTRFCLRCHSVAASVCTNACRIFRAQTIAQWGGCRPPHPPRDGVIKLMYCQGGGNACHDKALGGSTVVRAPLNGPRVPSPSLTLYRRPRTARLPTDPTPALSRTRPTLPWRPMYRVPEISCRPCRPTKNFVCHVLIT